LDVTEEELRDLFGAFGRVSSLLIQRDEYNNSKGFGFVNFESPEDAERAVNQLHDSEYFGKKLFVSRAQKKSEREDELRRQHLHQPQDQFAQNRTADQQAPISPIAAAASPSQPKYQGVNLYVKNLAEDVDDELLKMEFSRYGHITSAKVMKDEQTGISKGFGFVCFTLPEEATEAVIKMNGYKISTKEIYVALAQRKEDRRQLLESQQKSPVHSPATTSPVPSSNSLQPVNDQPTMIPPQLTLASLQMFSEEIQHQMLGERIYAIV
jgi:polyadenylate-binding protein